MNPISEATGILWEDIKYLSVGAGTPEERHWDWWQQSLLRSPGPSERGTDVSQRLPWRTASVTIIFLNLSRPSTQKSTTSSSRGRNSFVSKERRRSCLRGEVLTINWNSPDVSFRIFSLSWREFRSTGKFPSPGPDVVWSPLFWVILSFHSLI